MTSTLVQVGSSVFLIVRVLNTAPSCFAPGRLITTYLREEKRELTQYCTSCVVLCGSDTLVYVGRAVAGRGAWVGGDCRGGQSRALTHGSEVPRLSMATSPQPRRTFACKADRKDAVHILVKHYIKRTLCIYNTK